MSRRGRAWDARKAKGFSRWLVRQRVREDRIGALARRAWQDASWPFTATTPDAFVAHVEARLNETLLQALDEYNGRLDHIDVEVDWAALSWRLERTDDDADPGASTPAGANLARLKHLVRSGELGAARALLRQARRRADADAMRIVRDVACAAGDWPLVCEFLANANESLIEETFHLARNTGQTYLLDRTIELGSEAFLRRVYADARLLGEDDSLHIALAAAKALMPEAWQDWLPDDLLHAADVTIPRGKYPARLPPLPDDL